MNKPLPFATRAARIQWREWAAPWRYGAAFLIVVLATLLRMALPLDGAPFLLYMPGIFVIAFLLGRGPGVLATILSALVAIAFFMRPSSDVDFSWEDMLGVLLYILISLALIYICDGLAKSLRRHEIDLENTQAAKAALEDSESFLRSVLASSPDCIKVLDLEGRLTFMNQGGIEVMEVDDFRKIESCPWPDFWQGEFNFAAQHAIAEAKAGRPAHFQGLCETMAGTPKWWDVSVSPIMRSGDALEKLLVTSRDITEHKRAEAQQKLLNHELGHRLKNMLAMIQAVANQTLRRATSLTEASAAFDARLIALGKAQDVLTGTQWESADIGAIIRHALAPYGIDDGRFQIKGPPLMFSSRCVLALSLALHELATNAVKYGALSVEGGKVVISWNIRQEIEQLRFYLEWREAGGPPVVKPTRTGFGSFMIERSLSAYFKASARIEYDNAGVIFKLDAPATRIESEFQSGTTDILATKANINEV